MYDALAPCPWSLSRVWLRATETEISAALSASARGETFTFTHSQLKKNNADLRELLGLEPVSMVIKKGSLKWFGHMECKNDYDWNVD